MWQILNLRQIFSPLDHDTYICLCVVWILHSCKRSSFLSFWIYHTKGINILDFCLCLFTDLNQHDIEFITASDNTIPIWIPLCANPADHPKCILAFRGEDEEKRRRGLLGSSLLSSITLMTLLLLLSLLLLPSSLLSYLFSEERMKREEYGMMGISSFVSSAARRAPSVSTSAFFAQALKQDVRDFVFFVLSLTPTKDTQRKAYVCESLWNCLSPKIPPAWSVQRMISSLPLFNFLGYT